MRAQSRSGLRRYLIAIALGACGLALLPVPAKVAGAADGAAAPTTAEAWYRSLPALPPETSPCQLPTGCPPGLPAAPVPVPTQYPAGTLHVGVTAGVEESRTYLTFDLPVVATDEEITGGTLTLPVAQEPEAGTALPDTARLRACLVASFVRDGVQGDATGAPAIDCATSSPATFVPAAGDAPATFQVDLQPFVDTWGAAGSLALVPAEAPAPSENWHLAFSGRRRDVADSSKISAEIEVEEAFSSDFEDEIDPGLPSSADFAAGELFLQEDRSATFAAPPAVASDALPTDAPRSPEFRPAVVVVSGRFRYPGVFVLPLVIAVVGAWAGRAFTRDLARETI